MSVNIVGNKATIENKYLRREIFADENGLRTVSLFNKISGREYMKNTEVAEFQFVFDKKLIASYSKPEVHILDGNVRESEHLLKLESISTARGNQGRDVLRIAFQCPSFSAGITVCYEIYEDLPCAAKWIEIKAGEKDLHLHQMFFEMLCACPGSFADSTFMKHGLDVATPAVTLNGIEDIMQLHNSVLDEGIIVGNGAPGLLRYYMIYPNWPSGIAVGYNMGDADFNKFMKKGEVFVTDKAYICFYEGAAGNRPAFNSFRELVRRDLPECRDNGGVMYCTWLPFLKNINESLLLELVDSAASLGFTWFVVDDGWFDGNNWEVDRTKFPNGLKSVSDKVHKAGMKFGLWFNIGTDYGQVGTRPGNNALDYHGEPKPFGFYNSDLTVRCFATEHRKIMADKLSGLAREYGVDYFKLDFSNISSPYGIMPFGCTSCNHAYHRDFSDSVTEQYNSLMFMRNEVKKEFPDLVIDFSFESFGMEFPSIGALRFSEIHHSSNMNTLQPDVLRADKIRDTIYKYCNMLPNERILGSLICLQDTNDEEHLLSAMVGTPLVAGDLRKLVGDSSARLKSIVAALRKLTVDGPLTEFEYFPAVANKWDAYARYRKCGNGMLCVFRNGFDGTSAKVALQDVPEGSYTLRDMVTGDKIASWSASKLRSGVSIKFEDGCSYRAIVLEPKR